MPAQSSGLPILGRRGKKEGSKNQPGNEICLIKKYQVIFQDLCTAHRVGAVIGLP